MFDKMTTKKMWGEQPPTSVWHFVPLHTLLKQSSLFVLLNVQFLIYNMHRIFHLYTLLSPAADASRQPQSPSSCCSLVNHNCTVSSAVKLAPTSLRGCFQSEFGL